MRSRFGAAILGLIGLTAVGLCLAVPAGAASGVITRAEASSDWTHASIAGSVTWTGCEHSVPPPREPPGREEELIGEGLSPPPESPAPPICRWRPFAVLSPSSDCESAAKVTIWSEAERADLTTASFDLSEVPLNGQPGQYLCLEVIEIAQTGETIGCFTIEEPVPPGGHCPYKTVSYLHLLVSAPLSAGGAQVSYPASPLTAAPAQPATHRRHHRRHRHRHHRHRHHGTRLKSA